LHYYTSLYFTNKENAVKFAQGSVPVVFYYHILPSGDKGLPAGFGRVARGVACLLATAARQIGVGLSSSFFLSPVIISLTK